MIREAAVSELDIEDFTALLQYLRRRGIIDPLEQPVIRKLEGGVSNRVVLVKPQVSASFVLKQALEKLRVQVDWFCTPARAEREALALRYLSEMAPPGSIPALIFEDSEHHLLAMAEVPEPHENWKQMLLAGNLLQNHVKQFGLLLGSIHNRSARRSKQLLNLFGDRTIFEALRLEPYYRYTARQVPEAALFLNQLIADTLACRTSLVHGDYSPKNILVHDGRLVLLDFEVMHFGDPAFDIGFSLAHLLSKANHLAGRRTDFAEAAIQYWGTYASCAFAQSWISEVEPRATRHTLACCLARVTGRSPLEYLSPAERAIQARTVLGILEAPPSTIRDLVSEFARRLLCEPSNA